MKVRISHWFTLAIIFCILVALFPSASALAASDIPTPKSPRGTLLDKTPTYKWTVVSGAASYLYQLWKGDTRIFEKTLAAGSCGATTCSTTPTNTLGYNAYKWRVRAYVSGVYKPWSAWMTFSISPPSFNSQFNGSMDGWATKAGSAWTTNSYDLYSSGVEESWTSAYRTAGQFTDFDYAARISRDGPEPYYIVFRMGTNIAAINKLWYPGYYFGVNGNGYYGVFYFDDACAVHTLKLWTAHAAINAGGWNELRVIAKGSQIKCYINSTLVHSFTDTSRSRGFVGIAAYRPAGWTLSTTWVDYAKLSVLVTAQ